MCLLSVYVGCDIRHLLRQYLSVKGLSLLKERDSVIVPVIGPPRCGGERRGYQIETRSRRYACSYSPVEPLLIRMHVALRLWKCFVGRVDLI